MDMSNPFCPSRSLEEVTAEVLNNPHILCKVFKDLPLHDLLTCSLVSQMWYTLSREIIHKHKISYLDARNRSCVTLQELDKNIAQVTSIGELTSTSVPFNGLRLKMHTENIPFQTFPCVGSLMLDNLQECHLKYLEVEDRIDGDTCPLYSFISKFCETVQVIRGETIDDTLVPISLKKKTLDIVDRGSCVVFRLLPSCHQLQELLVHIDSNEFLDLPEHLQRTVKCLTMYDNEASEKLFELRSTKQDVKLISLHMYCNVERSTTGDFLRVCRMLIENSQDTLLELSMDIGSIQLNGIPVLRNLVRLIISSPDLPNSPEFLQTLLSRINLGVCFPRLKQVVIRWGTTWPREYDDLVDADIRPIYICETVESLTFDGVRFGRTFERWKEIFPRVKILKLHNQEMPFEEQVATVFESAWPELQVLDIDKSYERFENDNHLSNYDALLSGLGQAEIVQLQTMDTNQLRLWQFASSAPCLASFNQLKKLRIKFWVSNWPLLPDTMQVRLFSKVTRELVCRTIPGLDIELHVWYHTDDETVQESSLDHIKDFINFKGFHRYWT